MEMLPFCTRRYSNPRATALARRLTDIGVCGARQDAVRAERIGGGRDGAEARALRHRPAQDAVVLGFVRWRDARCDRRRRRSSVSPRAGADDSRRRTPAAPRPGAPLFWRRPPVRPACRLHRLFTRRSGRRRGADRRTAALDDGRSRRRADFWPRVREVLCAARRAADLRRDSELPGALGRDVRLRTARRDARHSGHRQGAGRRNHAARGDPRRAPSSIARPTPRSAITPTRRARSPRPRRWRRWRRSRTRG